MAASRSEAEIIVFNERFCGKKNTKEEKSCAIPEEAKVITSVPKSKIFNIKRARYEVIRYGMTGFDKQQHMDSKIAMAIRLGAKPPKKKYLNYKTLIEQKMKEKEKLNSEKRTQYNLQPLKQRKKTGKKKKLKNQPNSLV